MISDRGDKATLDARLSFASGAELRVSSRSALPGFVPLVVTLDGRSGSVERRGPGEALAAIEEATRAGCAVVDPGGGGR